MSSWKTLLLTSHLFTALTHSVSFFLNTWTHTHSHTQRDDIIEYHSSHLGVRGSSPLCSRHFLEHTGLLRKRTLMWFSQKRECLEGHAAFLFSHKIRLRQIDGFLPQKSQTSCLADRTLGWMDFACLVVQQHWALQQLPATRPLSPGLRRQWIHAAASCQSPALRREPHHFRIGTLQLASDSAAGLRSANQNYRHMPSVWPKKWGIWLSHRYHPHL